jgi:predicted membrane protein
VRIFRRLVYILFALLMLIVTAIGIVFFLRNVIAETLIIREFEKRGLAAELNVTDVSFDRLTIRNFVVEEFRISNLSLTYQFSELFRGQIREAIIEGLADTLEAPVWMRN